MRARILALMIWLLCSVLQANAFTAIEPYQNQLQGKIKKGDTLIVKDEKFLNNAFDWTKIHNRTVSNIITFGLYRDSGFVFTKSFKCQADLKIEYWSQPNQADPVVLDHIKLDIGYDSTVGKPYQASAVYRFLNGYKVKITVNDITSAELGATLPAAFSLTGQVIVERSYDIAADQTLVPKVMDQQATARTPVPTAANNKLSLIWPTIQGAEEYDLEWTFIDEQSDNGRTLDAAGSGISIPALAAMFRNNATRVTVPQEYYDISIINISKYLLVRIRFVNYDADGFRHEYPWNYDLDQSNVVGRGVITLSSEWHLPAFNWQYSAVYAEEGKKKEIISYFDGTLRSRQTVTVNNSDQKAVVQESIYDEFGRPLASILPVPLVDNTLKYYEGLHKKDETTNYNFSNIYGANTDCINTPQPLSVISGASQYYSPNNPFLADKQNKYIPDAGGYPFAVTLYTADNTNRPKIQGGVGALFQPGPDQSVSKATRYYYGKPQQWELDRLFGNDVGFDVHYLKNMVVDGNGQISVSYQNSAGKTIATSLAGAVPANTDSLTSIPAVESKTFLILKPEQFTFDNSKLKLSATTTYINEVRNTVSLTYTADKLIKTYSENGVTICSNCYYELRIRVTDDCNHTLYSTTEAVPVGSLTSNCNNTTAVTGTIDVDFDKIGEYYIYFELGLTDAALTAYTEDFVTRNTNLSTQWQFVQNALWGKDFASCFNDCSTCQASLGTKTDFIARVKERLDKRGVNLKADSASITSWVDSLYTSLSAQCVALRGNCAPSPCQDLENLINQDVSPGGQYALFDANDSALEKSINVLFLHWRDAFPEKAPSDPLYKSEQFELPNGKITSPYDSAFTLVDLVRNWKPQWASRFTAWHPENCALEFCKANSAYLIWDEKLEKLAATRADIPSYTLGAVPYSTTVSAWLVAGDPFFASGAKGQPYINAFTADLNNYSTNVLGITTLSNKGLTPYVDYLLYCSTSNTSTTANNWSTCTPTEDCRIRDREWSTYREMYMELKNKYYKKLRDSVYCISSCPIGSSVAYSMDDCPPASNFTIQIDTTATTNTTCKTVIITYIGSTPLTKATTVNLYYPSEYNLKTKVNSLIFSTGQSVKSICIDKSIDVNSMRIAEVTCGTSSGTAPTTPDPSFVCSDYAQNRFFRMSITPQSSSSNVTVEYIGPTIPPGITLYFEGGAFNRQSNGSSTINVIFHLLFTASTTTRDTVIGAQNGAVANMVETHAADCFGTAITPSTCDSAFKYKTSRLDKISYTLPVVSTDTTVLKAYMNAQLAAQIASNCAAQADNWMQLLDEGLTALSETDKTDLRNKLINVCKLGGDLNHPNGASTVPAGVNAPYTSFGDAIKSVMPGHVFTMESNPWLLDAPYPYDVKEQAATHIIENTNAEICTRLAALTAVKGNASLFDYLTQTYGAAMTLTSDEVDALQKGCTNCRYLLPQAIQLPVFLDGTATGCITRTEFNAGITAMGQETWLNTAHANYEGIYSTYLNQRWGFTLSYSDYKDFADTTSGMLCNHPVFAAVKVDPYSCMMEVIDDGVARGTVLYKEYMTEVRRKFRKEYIAYCSATQPKLEMTASQRLYHFTLYYYDQAGNLVRTIPPEGVHLLDASLEGQIDAARKNQEATCDYNDAVVNKDKPTALQQLTTLLETGGNSAMEMWLYNSSAGSNQVLFTTGGNKFLVNTCIDGGYLHLDTYTLIPSADGTKVDATLSTHTAASLQGIALKQWTHVVLQGGGLNTNNLSVYVNGKACPLTPDAPNGSCGWEINATPTAITYPENIAALKHIRLYNKLLSAAEIAANAGVPCLSLSPAYATELNNNLQYWGRFNVPAAGTATTIGGTTTETQFSAVYPAHTIPTSYAYHSLNGVTVQNSPDVAGNSRFWYDRLGRVVFSHNWEQYNPANGGIAGRYSYTEYDMQGRAIEIGEKTGAPVLAGIGNVFLTPAEVSNQLTTGTNAQVIHSFYDVPYSSTGLPQENLRKRISAITYQDGGTTPQQATYYSYDQMGNIKTLWQQIQDLGIQRMDYQYDLLSGKVNKLLYRRGATEKFYYNYQYDAENRLTKASTGINSVSADGWEIENPKTDASYRYYLHGPLARMEMGNAALVQGLDYAYTLQGWLKGVNGNYLNAAGDIGEDGVVGGDRAVIGRDAYAYTLDYYNGDYKSIGDQTALKLEWSPLSGDIMGRNLYNGNISRSTVVLSKINAGSPVGYSYRYDQLNRLVGMRQHTLTAGAAKWDVLSASTSFSEEVKYDGNGNILNYIRNGSGANGKQVAMDNLSYVYSRDGNGYLSRNWLRQVKDVVVGDPYTEDISNQGTNNYLYDNIGNLMKDVEGGVSNIQWTVYGKIRSITKTDGSSLEYVYDASGNRVYKAYTHGGITDKTWYVRDAQGNTLAVYGNKDGGADLYWKEQQLYGSSRLGIWEPNTLVSSDVSTIWNTLGLKRYELSNHLGNVLTTISDKPIQEGDHYIAEVLSAQDYYPFGMLQPDRRYSLGSYRYGFNGKENDNEVKGVGNQQDYGFRIYDPRLGRFLSVDPLGKKFPYYTPYQYAGNKPIWCVDLDGLEDLPSSALNKYGEKQVYEVTTTTEYGSAGPMSIDVQKMVPAYAQPATKVMTDIQVYQLAFSRFAEPGKHLINSNEYIDERLMKAEQQVDYFFSHQVPTFSKSTVGTRVAHTAVAFGLAQGDQAAVDQVKKSDNFLYRNNLASLIVGVAPIGAGLEIRNALAVFAKIEARSLKLLANGFKANWASGDLQASISRFVGNDATFELTESGKIIWKSENSSMQVIQDPLNKYFRVLDTRISGKRSYTDLNGNVPNNKVVNGRTSGNTQAEYNEQTHFNY